MKTKGNKKDKSIQKEKEGFSIKASLNKTINSKPFLFMLRLVVVLTVLWYILYGLVIFTEQRYMITNTEKVLKDTSKVTVIQNETNIYKDSDYVLLKNDDTLVFSDGLEKPISDIENYIRTVPGTKMWYIPDNHLVVPYLLEDLIKEGIPFYLVSIVLFIICILYAKKKKQRRDTKLGYISVISCILGVFELIVSVIYSYSFNWYNIEYTNILFYTLIGYTLVKLACIMIYNVKGIEIKKLN